MVLVAVGQDGHALRFASRDLRADRETVLAAVKQNGGCPITDRMVGTDVFDPRLNALQRELHKDLDPKLLPLMKFCYERNVISAS